MVGRYQVEYLYRYLKMHSKSDMEGVGGRMTEAGGEQTSCQLVEECVCKYEELTSPLCVVACLQFDFTLTTSAFPSECKLFSSSSVQFVAGNGKKN